MFGFISLNENKGIITISGINARAMARDIQKIWKTGKINVNMFTKLGSRSVSFHSFYALEIYYIIDQIIKYRNKQTGIRTLTAMAGLLEEQTWVGGAVNLENPRSILTPAAINSFVYKPLNHQETFFTKYASFGVTIGLRGYLLAAAPGAGKTYTSLLWAECLESDYTIIVGPKISSERVWESSVATGEGTPCLFKQPRDICVWWKARAEGKAYSGEKYIFVHYEDELNRLPELLKQITPYIKGKNVSIILDESHGIVNVNNDRTKNFITLATNPLINQVLFMSGTPIKAMGSEVIPMMRVIDPLFTPVVEESFKRIYGKDGGRALDILAHRMGFITHRVTTEELGLGEPVDSSLKVVIPNSAQYTLPAIKETMSKFITERAGYYKKNRPVYDQVYLAAVMIYEKGIQAKDEQVEFDRYQRDVQIIRNTTDYRSVNGQIQFANQYERKYIEPALPKNMVKDFRNAKSVYKYPTLKIMGECLGRVLGRLRIQCHIDMVPYIDILSIVEGTLKKTVVFTSYVEVLTEMEKRCVSEGLTPIVVYGKNSSNVDSLVSLFSKDNNVNPLIATFDSLSTAVPLIMADRTLMLNVPFREYKNTQAIARTNRIGKSSEVSVIRAFLDTGDVPNISTRSRDIMEWSKSQVEQIMGFTSGDIDTAVTEYGDTSTEGVGLEAFDIYEELSISEVTARKLTVIGASHSDSW